MDDKKRTYIDYDVETDNIIYIEEEKEKIELPDEITEEDLKEQQIKSVIKMKRFQTRRLLWRKWRYNRVMILNKIVRKQII